MISDNDLAKIQAEQTALMSETVYVQRITRTSDSAGGASEVWSTVATVAGRVALASGREQVAANRLGSVTSYVVTLPADTEVLHGDQLQVNGVQYQVEVVLPRSKQTALRVLCAVVQ